MPELPEVENVAAALREALAGRRLTGLEVRFAGVLRPSAAAVRRALLGKRLAAVRRQGKYILLEFAGGAGDTGSAGSARSTGNAGSTGSAGSAESAGSAGGTGSTPDAGAARGEDAGATSASPAYLMIHLRMTGQFFLDPAFAPDKHTHLALDFESARVWYRDIRKFGRLQLVEDGRRPRALAHVGPDMLEIPFAAWRARVAGRRAPIKAVLLDQGVAAGVGNIYADEALFRAGIHPRTPAARLDEAALRRLFKAVRAVLRLAIRHGGTTYLNFVNFRGQPGNFRRKLRVYQRTGEACGRCGASIAREAIGGRSSHYCPECQPAFWVRGRPRVRPRSRPPGRRPRRA